MTYRWIISGRAVVLKELRVAQIREDFDEGRVMRVEGWVLAETEAKLVSAR